MLGEYAAGRNENLVGPMTIAPPPRLVLAAFVPLVLAACAQATQSPASLALACQTRECVCIPENQSIFASGDTAPLQWKQNGDAYCPEGYVLELVRDNN